MPNKVFKIEHFVDESDESRIKEVIVKTPVWHIGASEYIGRIQIVMHVNGAERQIPATCPILFAEGVEHTLENAFAAYEHSATQFIEEQQRRVEEENRKVEEENRKAALRRSIITPASMSIDPGSAIRPPIGRRR